MKRIYVLVLFVLLAFSPVAFASQIPEAELQLLKDSFPKLNVRFDGMLQLPDGTSYIPVYPLKSEFPEENVELSLTVPSNKSLKDKPDFFMFNTNFAFFKVKKEGEKTYIIYNEQIPNAVKMGLLPQDLLVPKGFQIPAELRIIIGDLVIPFTPSKEYKEVLVSTGKEVQNSPRAIILEAAAEQLSGRYFYATSFNKSTLSVLNADTGKPFKQIEFSSIPSDMKLSNDGKYILLTTWRNNEVYIVDANKSEVLKDIKVGEKPSFIAVSKVDNIAYVANRDENTISVIDLQTMQALPKINVVGNPTYIELSADGSKLYYLDGITGIVYFLQKNDDAFNPYSAKPLFRTNNIAKIQLVDDKIYAFDRGSNELGIFYTEGKPQTTGLVNVSDITGIEEDLQEEQIAVNETADISEESDTAEIENIEVMPQELEEEKISFKEKIRKGFRGLLYYKEDFEDNKKTIKPVNQIVILDVKEEIKPEDTGVKVSKKKTGKEYFHEFLNYKAPVEPISAEENLKLQVEKQMDFIKPDKRANDFLVVNDKIYVLCSDDYLVYVYDLLTREQIGSFELEKIGYYNALKISSDKKIGIITNISSMSVTLFDTKNDSVVQKLPLLTNVHNVVITGKN